MSLSSELRLGNILQYDGRYVKIQPSDLLAIYQIEIAQNAGSRRAMDYCRVELTPEIMPKLGFEKVKFESDLRGEWSKGKYHVSLSKGKMVIVNGLGMYHYLGDCKYVHDLQNWMHLFNIDLQIDLS